jgi:DUF1009 family protein
VTIQNQFFPTICLFPFFQHISLVVILLHLKSLQHAIFYNKRTIINFLEKEGFTVLSPEIVAQDILADRGNMTNIPFRKSHMQDMERGYQMLNEICKLDVGQALIIQNG